MHKNGLKNLTNKTIFSSEAVHEQMLASDLSVPNKCTFQTVLLLGNLQNVGNVVPVLQQKIKDSVRSKSGGDNREELVDKLTPPLPACVGRTDIAGPVDGRRRNVGRIAENNFETYENFKKSHAA